MPLTALLFTDIEGSTRLMEKDVGSYALALQQHHEILRRITTAYAGSEFQDAGDGLLLAFSNPLAAAGAALDMQQALAAATWPQPTGAPHVRMALHWAETEFREGQYRGSAVHFTARLLSAGHGGQILFSQAMAGALEGKVKARRLGAYRLRGFARSEAVFQSEDEKTFPPLRVEQARRHNLPNLQDAFIGREQELRELAMLLDPGSALRIVTLTGPGGIGKTRLAMAGARQMLEPYEHGVIYVPLADATDAGTIPEIILRALDVQSEPGKEPLSQISKSLAGMPTLVVLDNFEQLPAEGALMVQRLCQELPLAHFLITSRSRLGLPGEKELPVQPLPVPAEGTVLKEMIGNSEAVRLFLDRAAHARPGFALTAENAGHIGEICRHLDGLPLALELAAARMHVLTARELEEALRAGFNTEKSEMVPGLHRSVEMVFDWSVRMLPRDVSSFLMALSVFRGGWTTHAATEVTASTGAPLTLAYLHYLLTCSLVQTVEGPLGMRFTMLEPIRQLAEKRLKDDRERAAARHRAYFVALVRRARDEFGTGEEAALVSELEPESANILAALESESANQQRLTLAVDFHQFALYRGCNRQVRSLLTTLRPEGGEVQPQTLARAWNATGALDHVAYDLENAGEAYRRAAALFEQTGERHGLMAARYNIAAIAMERGDHVEARGIFLETLAFFDPAKAPANRSTILSSLAILARRLGRLEEARLHADQCLALLRQMGETAGLASALCVQAEIQIASDELESAQASLAESLTIELRLAQHLNLSEVLSALAVLAAAAENWTQAAFFRGAVERCAQKYRTVLSREAAEKIEHVAVEGRRHLGERSFENEVRRGAEAPASEWLETAKRDIFAQNRIFSASNPKSNVLETKELMS